MLLSQQTLPQVVGRRDQEGDDESCHANQETLQTQIRSLPRSGRQVESKQA